MSEFAGVNATVPNAARIYNYFAGGKDNFEVDRAAAEVVLSMAPEVRDAVRENRDFLVRAVEHLVKNEGIRQFIDIGAGIPTVRPVHEVAQAIDPTAAVAYIDNDTVVLVHARALLATNPATIVMDADVLDPEAILDAPELRALIDLTEPVAVLLIAILHFVPDHDDPAGLVRRLLDRLPSGSFVVITHLSDGGLPDDPRIAKTQALYGGGLYMRTYEAVETLFNGLDLTAPGLVGVSSWPTPITDNTSWWLGGMARKP